MEKKLYRSKTNVMVSGVCAGIGEYFNIDPTIIRLITIFAGLWFNVLAILAYFICVVVVPVDNGYIDTNYREKK